MIRVAVDRCRRREDHLADPGLAKGFNQVECIDGIVAIIFKRVGDTFTDFDGRGKMHHCTRPEINQRFCQQLPVRQVTDHQVPGKHSLAAAGREVVISEHFATGLAKGQDDMAADIAGATGHQHTGLIKRIIHNRIPSSCVRTSSSSSAPGRKAQDEP